MSSGFVGGLTLAEGRESRRGRSSCCNARLDELQVGEVLLGVVRQSGGANSAWVDCGVVRTGRKGVEVPTNGRLRANRGEKPLAEGEKVVVQVRRVQPANGRFEVVRGANTLTAVQTRNERAFEELQVGDELRAEVVYLYPRGALVDVGVWRTGKRNHQKHVTALMQRHMFLPEWASEIDQVLKPGSRIIKVGDSFPVYVLEKFVANGHLRVGPSPMTSEEVKAIKAQREAKKQAALDRRAAALPEPGKSYVGVVQKTLNFGVLLDIGWMKRALLHWTKLPDDMKYTWRDELSRGMEIDVTVIVVRDDGDLEVKLKEDAKTIRERFNPALARTPAATDPVAEPSAKIDSAMQTEEEVAEEEEEEMEEEGDEEDDFLSDDYLEDKYGY